MGFDPRFDDKKEKNTINLGVAKFNKDGSSYRMIDMMLEPEKTMVKVKIKDALVLRGEEGGRQKISCWLTEYPDGSKTAMALNIDNITKNGNIYGDQQICLHGGDVKKLRVFIDTFLDIDTKNKRPFSIPYENLEELHKVKQEIREKISKFSIKEMSELFSNIDNIEDVAKISGIKQKSQSLKRFKGIIDGNYKNEKEIENFLEDNLWILGNEFSVFIPEKQINKENILDLIPSNYEGFIDVVELKTPKEKLFNEDSSHNNLYPSSHLTKAISQTQNYLFELEKMTESEEYEKNNNCKIIKPRGLIIYGSETELTLEEIKYLRILNSSYHNISIYTYQQIYKRAENILEAITQKERVKYYAKRT